MAEKAGLIKVIRTRRWLILALLCLLSPAVSANTQPGAASEESKHQMAEQHVNQLDKPLYSAFTERYILDEVKNLRQGIADVRVEMTTKIVDREIELADRALTYATDTVTYFFYLLAGASSLLVIIGWNSLRDVKERVGSYANEEIHRITASYEERLEALEKELSRKSKHIKAA